MSASPGVNHRDHRKIVVVDGEYAFAGGVNFSQAYHIASKQARRRGLSQQKALHEGWRDTHIAIRGTAARHLEDLFRGTWRDAECHGESPAAATRPPSKPARPWCRSSPAPPTTRPTISTRRCSRCSPTRRSSVDVTMAYFVPDDTLEKAIKDAARRGVAVRIILPSYSDFSGVFYAGRAHYDELLESGVSSTSSRTRSCIPRASSSTAYGHRSARRISTGAVSCTTTRSASA